MDDLEALRAEIPGYAGYSDAEARHLVDKQLRAWVGERLAALEGRLGLSSGPLASAYEHLISECEFSDPHVMRELEERKFDDSDQALIYRLDRRLMETADRAPTIDAQAAAEYLSELEHLFSSRSALILEEAAS